MKRVVPQESEIDCPPSSLSTAQAEASGGYRRVQTSAAMLGLALSFGASAPLLTEPELALAADGSSITVLPAASREKSQTAKLVPAETATSSAYHTVEPGESLWHIAAQHKADVQAIKVANGIAGDDVLRAGQVIRVPAVGMASLSAPAEASRLALKADAAGGVGGDLAAASGLVPSGDVLSVDELEKSWQLEDALSLEALSLTAEEELSEEELAKAELEAQLEETALDPLSGDVDGQLATVPQPQISADSGAIAQPNPVSASPALVADARLASPAAQVGEATVSSGVETSASLPLYDEGEPPAAAAPVASSTAVASAPAAAETKKDIAVAALPLRPAAVPTADVGTVRSYQVKPGDTLWSIASRNGLTLDELLSHNRTVSQPETLSVGDSLSIPLASAAEEPVSLPTSGLAAAPRNREQVIRDHLARIRESNSTSIDRDQLNARIREARQELERSRAATTAPAEMPLEYHSSAPVSLAASGVGGTVSISESALASREGSQAPVPASARSQWTVTDVAESEAQPVAALTPALETAVEEPAQLNGVNPPSQLLAAAPLSADAYRVSPSMPVGQTVSPSMPMMPGASEFLPEAPSLSNGFIWPTRGTLTSGYGWRWGRMHRGVDIAGPVGTPIVAAAPGVVVRSGWNSGGYGNLVDIRHSDGSMTRYAHNSRLLVRQGEQVRQGQQIAEMGSTGYSTGPHLHFEVHLPNSGTVNPMAYLPGR
ncbi:peptidoglycan DD-metalloendopeptidase family protein [Nodosilinea sp. PGN35]|uniref:peptidoglycan DD-metalloendopeptidase family protein n=1 Tax=Nodosilinea sp. PGN35 TaxID=3020489 RepID=UPI0023B2A24D|nr:peptidoglycan DD-metalloendopeptidase family protein [Nodosilinea sp. TSF1-S3]MDF0369071.1 peptidoglycan DD-metalloendopeptidase family protein [Nodosilinea sp. TSF1-S3]